MALPLQLVWNVLEAALALPLIFFLPGYLSLRAAATRSWDTGTKRQQQLGAVEAAFFSVALSASLTSWLALLLAEIGYLRLEVLVGVLVLVCFGLWCCIGREAGGAVPEQTPFAKSAVALAGLMCLAAVLFTPPYQTTLWGSDATVYVNFGQQIRETGALLFDDDLLDLIPQPAREELFRNRLPDDTTADYARFPGGFSIPDITDSRVGAGFSPLFPVWIAIFHRLFGQAMSFYVSPVFGILAVGAVFLVGRRLHGTRSGLFAGLLLSVCLPQIWFARIPMSEVVSQFFVFAGLLAVMHYLEVGARLFAAAAGLMLGVALFAGFELIPVLTLTTAAVSAYLMFTHTPIANRQYFFYSFGFFLLHSLAHAAYFPSNNATFLRNRLSLFVDQTGLPNVLERDFGSILLVAAIGLFLLFAASAFVYSRARYPGKQRVLAWMLCGGMVLYAAAYFSVSPSNLPLTIDWLAWYLTWPLLVVFALVWVATVAVKVVGEGDLKMLTVSALLTVTCMHYLYNPQDHELGDHIWTMRRFVPVVIPGVLLMFSVSVAFLFEHVFLRHGRWLGQVALLPFFALVLQPSLAIIGQPLWPNGVQESRALAQHFPANSVILVGRELAGTHVPTTLSYLHGRDSVLLQQQYPDSRILSDLVGTWLRGGRQVFFLVGRADTHFHAPELDLTPYRKERLDVPVLETTRAGIPRRIVQRSVDMKAFEVRSNEQGPASTIDIGSYAVDALFVLRGFHEPEIDQATGITFRWTQETASFEVPSSARLTLVVGGGRPAGTPAAKVRVWVDDKLVIEDQVIPDAPTELAIQSPSVGHSGLTRVTIGSNSFRPSEHGSSSDERNLGVRIYRLAFD